MQLQLAALPAPPAGGTYHVFAYDEMPTTTPIRRPSPSDRPRVREIFLAAEWQKPARIIGC
jgi:hypothetical protein